jgi:hypothetical protein
MLNYSPDEIADINGAREKISKPLKSGGSVKTDSSMGEEKKSAFKDMFKKKSKNLNESANSAANLSSEVASPAPIRKS